MSYMLDKEELDPTDEKDVHGRIAQRLRELRSQRGYTLDVLAAKSGVSRSMISLIERGAASPTAVVLNRLAAGLGVSLASLFAGIEESGPAPSPLVAHAKQAVWKDPDSGYLRRSVSPPGWPSPMQLVEVQFPAGARVAYEANAGESPLHQQVWLLAGRIDIVTGATTHTMQAGDCLAMRLDQPIVFSNPTQKTARYLVAICDATGFN